jgi:signal transduction histidine kinase
MSLIIYFPLAAAVTAIAGMPATPGGTWPAIPPLLAEVPESIFTAHYVWIAAVVIALAILAITGLLKFRDAIVREIQSALRSEERPARLQLQQPIQIEHVARFVSVEHFNAKFGEIDKRFLSIEQQIEKTVRANETYLHGMRHELRNEMQALRLAAEEARQTALTSTGKVHGRVDGVAESLARVSGSVESLREQLGEIRQLLIEKALHHP